MRCQGAVNQNFAPLYYWRSLPVFRHRREKLTLTGTDVERCSGGKRLVLKGFQPAAKRPGTGHSIAVA